MKNKKSKLLKTLFINGVVLLVMIILLEVGLRLAGYEAGVQSSYINIKKVDSLIVLNEYFTDSNGIYRANRDWDWEPEVHINSSGFRSRELTDTANPEHKTRLLLLGDSFTWGYTAEPVTNCFADLLIKEGYQVFNLGIPGTDPAQYAALAETYIPKIQPDIVIVTFYMGNDLMKELRELVPYQNIYHVTNAGGILATIDGKYIADPHEAYRLQMKKLFSREFDDYHLREQNYFKWAIKKILYQTVLGSRLLILQANLSSKYHAKDKKNEYFFIDYLTNIKALSDTNHTRFLLYVIPWQAEAVDTTLFEPLKPLICPSITVDDYKKSPDDHFNNQGHKKFFEYMLETINEGQ